MTTRAAMYLRISQDRESTEYGIDRQREECQAVAERIGADVVDIYSDNDIGASTRSRKRRRPEYERMLADLDAGRFGTIVAYSMSRLTRRPREAEGLLERAERGELLIRTARSGDPDLTTADGRALFRTLVAFDTAEAERIAERVTAAAEQRAKRGAFGGGQRRFGYTEDASALVPAEAEALAAAYVSVANGGSLEGVVRDWKRRGLTGTQGGRITGVQVRDVLLRHMNAGIAVYRGQVVGETLGIPAVVDPETFWRVRETLLDPARRTTVGRPASTLLAPVLRCAVCGRRMSGSSRNHGRNHPSQRSGRTQTYACRDRHVSRVRDRLDDLIGDLVVEYLIRNAATLARPQPAGGASAALAEVASLRDRLERLQRLAGSGALDPEDFAAAAGGVRASLAAAEVAAVAEAGRTASVALVNAGDIRAAWAGMSIEGRRSVVKEIIDTITVSRGTSGKFSAEGIEVRWRG